MKQPTRWRWVWLTTLMLLAVNGCSDDGEGTDTSAAPDTGADSSEQTDTGVDANSDSFDVEIGDAPSEDDSSELRPTAVAVFDPPADGALAFGVIPFPSDLYLDADGSVEIRGVPQASSMVNAALEFIGHRVGFCRTCPISFYIDGPLDPSSIPDDAARGAPAAVTDPFAE